MEKELKLKLAALYEAERAVKKTENGVRSLLMPVIQPYFKLVRDERGVLHIWAATKADSELFYPIPLDQLILMVDRLSRIITLRDIQNWIDLNSNEGGM